MWESVIDSQEVRDAEDARNRALGELQNASMEWQRAEVRCEGDHRIRPGMRVTLKYVGERFSGEYVVERVEHELGAGGFITEVRLRRNMLPGEPKSTSGSGCTTAETQEKPLLKRRNRRKKRIPQSRIRVGKMLTASLSRKPLWATR